LIRVASPLLALNAWLPKSAPQIEAQFRQTRFFSYCEQMGRPTRPSTIAYAPVDSNALHRARHAVGFMGKTLSLILRGERHQYLVVVFRSAHVSFLKL
jgi:hypothetical protein